MQTHTVAQEKPNKTKFITSGGNSLKDWVTPSEQSSIINRSQYKDCSTNYTGQTPIKLATRINEQASTIWSEFKDKLQGW